MSQRLSKGFAFGAMLAAVYSIGAAAQTAPPLILRTNTRMIDVRDGDKLHRQEWAVDPRIALDVYDADRTTSPKRVTFISPIDSVSIPVVAGQTYDFLIVLNGRDTCRTRISTLHRGSQKTDRRTINAPTTIPIRIVRGKLHLSATVNGSRPLDLIFDTGADANILSRTAMDKGAGLTFDGTGSTSGVGGQLQYAVSRGNRLEIGGLRWDYESFGFAERFSDHDEDGIVGYTIFQDKVVELDYDRMVMVVHDVLPAHAAHYTKVPMPAIGSLTGITVTLGNDGKKVAGQFIIDAAAGGAMNVGAAFATKSQFFESLPKVGTTLTRGVGPNGVRNNIYVVPEISVAGFVLKNVPVHVAAGAGGEESHGGTLNMEILSRFNTLLDYPRMTAYLTPNARFGAPFKSMPSRLATLLNRR